MYGSTNTPDESERTAFRKAEKKYKLYKHNDAKSSSKRQKQPKPVDLSDVVDFKQVLEPEILPPGVFKLKSDFDFPVFCLEDHPGFYFIPAALSTQEQCHWIRESLTSFPQPPNRTNHCAIYGHIHDLFIAAQQQKVLIKTEAPDKDLVSLKSSDAARWHYKDDTTAAQKEDSSVAAFALLRKLRWSTLGLQFDWSKRNYDVSLPHNKIPESLCQLAKRMAEPAMPRGGNFHPEAAIVNYFGAGDMLGGHLDDMEADWSKPIVSISLGCKAIFLLGGKSRGDLPIAVFLRSGDVVLMAGPARECFHGVPRIFTDKENAEITPLATHFSHPDDLGFLDYITSSRININIREVF